MIPGVSERVQVVRYVTLTVAVAGFAAASEPHGGSVAAAVVLVGGVGDRSRGVVGLAGWILAGALLGGALGYVAAAGGQLPLSTAGVVGLGIALGGGLGGLTQLLSSDDPVAVDDEQVTVDMANRGDAGPRPADLFEHHPEPVLYVTDAGAGPVVRAANAAYESAFDLPATALEDAPLGDVLVPADAPDPVVDPLADGEGVDEVLAFETPEGRRDYRVRSVSATADGYLLFTPIDGYSSH